MEPAVLRRRRTRKAFLAAHPNVKSVATPTCSTNKPTAFGILSAAKADLENGKTSLNHFLEAVLQLISLAVR